METTIDKTPDGMPRRKASENAKDSPDPQKRPLVTPESEVDSRGASRGKVLGPDGEAAQRDELQSGLDAAQDAGEELAQKGEEFWSDLPTRVGEFVKREPITAALASLGLGLVVGAILGAALAKD